MQSLAARRGDIHTGRDSWLGPPRLYADNGAEGNTLDGRNANRMTVLRSTHSRVAGSNTPRGDNTRIPNGDSRSCGPVPSQFPEFQFRSERPNAARERKPVHLPRTRLRKAFSPVLSLLPFSLFDPLSSFSF